MCWGDVKLHQTALGEDYLESNERQTKTRTGSDYRDVRTVPPKMFATDGSEKDPVADYKFFSEKRPREVNYDDAPFYLSVNNFKATDSAKTSTKAWFKSSAVGTSKLNSLVKSMAAKAGIENSRLRNHSGRKTMVQRFSESHVPPTHIAQLSGHKSLKIIHNYSSVSTNQQMHMSKLLSG